MPIQTDNFESFSPQTSCNNIRLFAFSFMHLPSSPTSDPGDRNARKSVSVIDIIASLSATSAPAFAVLVAV